MNTFRRMESLCGDRLHHVYDALSGAGFRSSLTGATIMCLFAVIAVGCGDDEPASPGPTEPRTTEPTATDATTQPTVTKEPTGQPTPTEPIPTKGGGMSQSPEPAPPVLTDGDDGRVVSLAIGAESSLQLDSAWVWDEPAVQGEAVALTRVDYLIDPGFMEWIVTAELPGTAVVTVDGEPNCGNEAECPPRVVRVMFEVSG